MLVVRKDLIVIVTEKNYISISKSQCNSNLVKKFVVIVNVISIIISY